MISILSWKIVSRSCLTGKGKWMVPGFNEVVDRSPATFPRLDSGLTRAITWIAAHSRQTIFGPYFLRPFWSIKQVWNSSIEAAWASQVSYKTAFWYCVAIYVNVPYSVRSDSWPEMAQFSHHWFDDLRALLGVFTNRGTFCRAFEIFTRGQSRTTRYSYYQECIFEAKAKFLLYLFDYLVYSLIELSTKEM